jgi:hypothetical protein
MPGHLRGRRKRPSGLGVASNLLGMLGGTSEPGGVVGIAAGLGQLGGGYELGVAPAAAWSGGRRKRGLTRGPRRQQGNDRLQEAHHRPRRKLKLGAS